MLSGRLAVVTGAGRGIGRAVCKVMSREGARVVAADIDLDACKQTLEMMPNNDHHSVLADVSSFKSIQEASDNIFVKYERSPDVVVNCAGITRDAYLLKMTEELFDRVIKVNLKGTFNVNNTFANKMKAEKLTSSSIINISSISGQVGNMGQANYSASKAGVIGFTKTAAKELGKFGIRVNCIAPGFIQTPMTESIPEHIKQIMLMQIPLGEFGQAEDIAEVAAFLASNRSRYMNGAIINVNGGLY